MKGTPFLEVQNISKSFPGVKALEKVNLEVYPGEILAMAGENGAGKSTLMKILTGVYAPDPGGKILLNQQEVQIKDPVHARQLGISIIYQELTTVDNLTVAENIFLAKEPKNRFGLIDSNMMIKESRRILDLLNMEIDPKTKVGRLSTGQQQMIEIAKAISYDSKVIIMDEPTASLSHHETRTLMGLVKELKKKNISIIYISHRLEELFEIADRITVLRDGRTVDTLSIEKATPEILVKKMVDRELSEIYTKHGSYVSDEVILEVKNLSQVTQKDFHKKKIENISFTLHKGEILGISGLVGAGRTEIMELIFGITPHHGDIFIEGKKAAINSPFDAIAHGIGFVTEDRKRQGLVLGMTIRENFSLTLLELFSKFNFVNRNQETKNCKKYVDSLGIKTPSTEQKVINLSGGNQQKVVISKWIALHPKVLIMDEPTRGIDIGAKAEVHTLITDLAKQGVGIIMVSSDLPEVLAMSDRVIVVREGRITGEFKKEEASQELVMHAATGQNHKNIAI